MFVLVVLFGMAWGLVALLAYAIRKAGTPARFRRPALVALSVLVVMPVLGPATIVAVPVPMGLVLGAALAAGEPLELFDLLAAFWWFSLPSLLATLAASSWLAWRFVR
ncbi:MAG: hypothetical protein H6923_08470 [Alphaproteobacteria bacterium]|nr:hypothetical protein [Alphaproteobacteria bacterium]